MARIRLLAGVAMLVAAGGCGFRTSLDVPGAFEFVSVSGPPHLVQGQTLSMSVTLRNRSSARARPPALGLMGDFADALSVAFDPSSVPPVDPGAEVTIHPHLSSSTSSTPQQTVVYQLTMLDSGAQSADLSVSILRMATLVVDSAVAQGNACTGVANAGTPSAGAAELKGVIRNVGDSPAVIGAEAGAEIAVGGTDVTSDFQEQVTGSAGSLSGITIAPQASVAFDWLLHAAAGTPLAEAAQVVVVANATDGTTGAAIDDPSGTWTFPVLSPVRFEWSVTTAPATVSGGQTGLSLVLTASQPGTSRGTITALAPKFFASGADVSADYAATTVTTTPLGVTAGETGIAFQWTIDVAATPTKAPIDVAPSISGTDDACGIALGGDAAATANVSKAVWQAM